MTIVAPEGISDMAGCHVVKGALPVGSDCEGATAVAAGCGVGVAVGSGVGVGVGSGVGVGVGMGVGVGVGVGNGVAVGSNVGVGVGSDPHATTRARMNATLTRKAAG